MPELPEVETVKRILEGSIIGKTIEGIRIFHKKSIIGDPDQFVASLRNKTFLRVTRNGKFLVFHLSEDYVILSHLRMEGKYFESEGHPSPSKHDILIYDFTDGTSLRYNDVRKFGILILKREDDYLTTPPLSELGKEPWALSAEELHEGLKRRKGTTIKEALLDQTLIAGLGNIYDDEVLFASFLNPKRRADSLSMEECRKILKESRRILEMAIENGGSTIRSYHPKEGMSGMMQNALLAYGQGNKPCSRCKTPLRKISIGGRGTVYCPRCQKIEGKPFIVGITGPVASGKSRVSEYLKNHGYEVIDADRIAHEAYEDPDPEVLAKLKSAFPSNIFDGKGKTDKLSLLRLASSDKKERDKLNAIIHPYVFKAIEKQLEETSSKKIALDVPLLISSPLEEMCDLIIGVSASEKTRKERLEKRNGESELYLKLNDSFPLARLKKVAGIFLENEGDIKELEKRLSKYKFLSE